MFKNATTYLLTKSAEEVFGLPFELEDNLARFKHKPIGTNDFETLGWVPTIPGGTELVHLIGSSMILGLRRDTKVIPNDAVQSELNDKVAEIEASQGRTVTRKEKTEMKERIVNRHLPTAPVKTKYHYVMVSKTPYSNHEVLVVDSASDKVCTDVTSFLRKSIGSLPINPLTSEKMPSSVFATWLKDGQFEHLGTECVLLESDGKGRITFTDQDSLPESTEEHLDSGMVVRQVMLQFEDRSFVVNDNLVLKKLKCLEHFEETYDSSLEGMDALQAYHFLNRAFIMTTVDWVIRKMGGIARQEEVL